ncbi:MAG: HNH endonuclease [Nostocaceae cyanobacterium]|nr:HNH endonuclease [Nostocaceae cyanobacterium]
MSRRYIIASEQQFVIERAQRRCEYCQCPMDYSSQSFVCEHITPIAKGGETSLENLALACGGCNSYKYTKLEAVAPTSDLYVPLYHPRQDIWQEHFDWSEDKLEIIGITPTARATINALNLNRTGVKNIRRLLMMANLHPPS